MFLINWGYALANISVALLVYIYIGQANPGLSKGKPLTVFLELRSRKTVRFSEQVMSKDKYPSIFLKPNGGYC